MNRNPAHRFLGRYSRNDPLGSLLHALSALLSDERYAQDPQLPSERELAITLGVSRRILRRALERLEAEGKIWRHHGKGTFVGSRPVPAGRDEPSADSTLNPIEVLDARLQLEPNLAALAAIRATSAEISYIKWCLTRSKAATDLETFELWDGRLHRAIAEAAHNALLLELYDMVNMARSRAFWGVLQHAAIKRSGFETIAREHSAFVDAIVGRDAIEARRRMRMHIAAVRDSMFDREEMRDAEMVAAP